MLEISVSELQQWLGQFVWPLFRIAAFLMAAPIFGTRLVSSRIRLSMALLITAMLMPLFKNTPMLDLSLSMINLIVEQVLIGLTMGFCLQIVLHLFVITGQIVAMQMGLGFASMNDPANGVNVTVLSQFYLMMTMLLFLAMGGHLVAIQALVESFNILPIKRDALFFFQGYRALLNMGGWMFGSALLIALPIISALLIVNISFGIMTRSAPQLNIFSLGFPMTLLFGLFCLWVYFADFSIVYTSLMEQGFDQLNVILRTH